MTFDRPLFLLALLVLPLFWWVGMRSLVPLDPFRRNTALILRSVIVVCVVLALAGLNWIKTSGANCVLFVVDASYSVPREQRQKALDYVNQGVKNMREQDKVGVLTVGSETRLAYAPAEKGTVVADLSIADGSQTNLARGINSALSYFPENTARRIVLLSDGNETTGSLAEAARSAAAEGVAIDVVPLDTRPENETLLDRMLTPPTAKRGEPFPMKLVATSLKGGTGTVKLYRNGQYIGEQKVELKPGKNAFTVPQKVDEPGFYTYEARLTTNADTFAENNKAVSFVKVQGKPRVLLVRPTDDVTIPESFLPKALQTQNVIVDVVAPAQLPKQATSLLNYDGLILSDVPAFMLSETQQRLVQSAVRDLGLGLIMVGGQDSFGAGGYWQTPIEEALPVDMDIRKMRRFPGVALAMAIDYSGSMESQGQVTTSKMSKLELAQEAAHRAVDALNAQDQVGIIAVDTRANIVYEMNYATDKRAIHSAIGAIWGGSGTEMSAGVKACYEVLSEAKAKVKHAILVTDGETGPYDYGDVIQAMRDEKITFSLVIIDEGQSPQGIEPLRRVVNRTGGRFYKVRDPAEIPKIYTREVLTVSKPPILEEAFVPRVASAGTPLLSGINWGATPPLLGYDVVIPKPTAEIALVSHKGDPVLATWQYGLGKSVAFTADAKARWGAQWLNWSAYGPFWAQAVRWSLKKPETGSYQSGIDVAGGKGRITIDAVDEQTGAYVNFLEAKARVVGPDGTAETVRLSQTGAGRYIGTFDASKTGSYVATLSQTGRDGKTRVSSVGLAVPYSPEYASLATNTPLLFRTAEMTGGKVLKDGQSVFKERSLRVLPVPLAMPLLLVALLVFPLDVANRRLALSPKVAAAFAEKLREQAEARRAEEKAQAAQAAASVVRLNARKAMLENEEQEVLSAESRPTQRISEEISRTPTAEPSRRSVTWGNTPSSPVTTRSEQVPNPEPAKKTSSTTSNTGGGSVSRLLDAKRRAARDDD